MNQIQTRIYKLALEFKKICKQNNLKYFIIAGSLLGAVRHGGFIPWDDDIDFAMPRPDYKRFLELAKEINFPYKLRDFSVDREEYGFCFAKLDDTQTTFIEKSLSNFQYRGGVYIDIFPLDGTFDIKILQSIHLFIIWHLVRLREIAYISKIKPQKGLIYNIALRIVQKTCRGKILFTIINFFLTLKDYKKAKYIGNLVWGYKEKEIIPKTYYEPYSKIVFERDFFQSPAQTDAYLKAIYDDYMTPPPKHERISQHPVYYLNLDLPYKDFKYDIPSQ